MIFSELTDNELVENIKNKENSNESLNELIDRHSGLYVSMIEKFAPKNTGQNFEDLKNEKFYLFYDAALKFNPLNEKKSQFHSYLGNRVKWMCLAEKTKIKKTPTEINFNLSSLPLLQDNTLDEIEEIENQERIDQIFEELKKMEDNRVSEIFFLRYCSKSDKLMTWKEISKKMELSSMSCINIHKKGLEYLKQIKNNAKL